MGVIYIIEISYCSTQILDTVKSLMADYVDVLAVSYSM
jgi:hypothetical protein